MVLQVATLEQDCLACPSSWTGQLMDGRWIRIRYRWGYLRVAADLDQNNLSIFSNKEPSFYWGEQIGSDLDGFIDIEEVKRHLNGVLDFSVTKIVTSFSEDDDYPNCLDSLANRTNTLV